MPKQAMRSQSILSHYGLLDDAIGNILENKNFTVDKYTWRNRPDKNHHSK